MQKNPLKTALVLSVLGVFLLFGKTQVYAACSPDFSGQVYESSFIQGGTFDQFHYLVSSTSPQSPAVHYGFCTYSAGVLQNPSGNSGTFGSIDVGPNSFGDGIFDVSIYDPTLTTHWGFSHYQ